MTTETLHTEVGARPPIDLSLDEAKEILGRVVEKAGPKYRYVSGDPRYFDEKTGKCSCIVGHLLAEKGITMLDLEPIEGNSLEVQGLVREGLLRVDGDTEALLMVVQTEQDNGRLWTAALQEALDTYAEFGESLKRFHDAYEYQA